jgi:hypothetical protein
VSFTAITLRLASQLAIAKVSVNFVMTQSGNFWIHPCILFLSFIPGLMVNPAISVFASAINDLQNRKERLCKVYVVSKLKGKVVPVL